MNLNTQIKLIIFSFVFGICFNILLNISQRLIYSNNKFVKISTSFLLITLCTIIYIICLYKINYGIVHIYSYIIIILGYLLSKKMLFNK